MTNHSDTTDAIFQAFGSVRDDEWLQVLLRSVQAPEQNGVCFPPYPPEDLQREIHGHAGDISLHEAHVFYREIKAYCAYAGCPIRSDTTLLDVGCGWGRMARLFMKDVRPERLFGVEQTDRFLMAARRANPCLTFFHNGFSPAVPLQGESVDVVTSWSSFAHFSEFLADQWVREIHRVLKPGGLAVITTQSRRFLAFCAEQRLRRASGMRLEHPWHEACADSFKNETRANAAFDAGHFLHAASAKPPLPQAHYGEAIIPRNYVLKAWGHLCRLVEYMDNPTRLPHVLIVLQKIS